MHRRLQLIELPSMANFYPWKQCHELIGEELTLADIELPQMVKAGNAGRARVGKLVTVRKIEFFQGDVNCFPLRGGIELRHELITDALTPADIELP